jgi:tetratricopeptide (TPR) repeat protein
MASKKENVEFVEVEQSTEPILDNEKNGLLEFWNKYKKIISSFVIGLLVGVLSFFAYKHFVKEPNEVTANETIFPAEKVFGAMANTSFSKDSVNVVLNGGVLGETKVTGLLSIINKYGSTAAGNRANYLVGATYLHTGEFEKAIKYLKEFSPNGAYQTDIKKYTMLGHAYAELKKVDEAMDAYKKAASVNKKDENFTADALMVAGAYAEANGKIKEAIDFYTEARDNYPKFPSVQNGDVDKFLAKLGVTK